MAKKSQMRIEGDVVYLDNYTVTNSAKAQVNISLGLQMPGLEGTPDYVAKAAARNFWIWIQGKMRPLTEGSITQFHDEVIDVTNIEQWFESKRVKVDKVARVVKDVGQMTATEKADLMAKLQADLNNDADEG